MLNRTPMELESGIFELRELGTAIKNSGAEQFDVQMVLRGIDSRINTLSAEKAAINTPVEVLTVPAKKV